MKKKNRGAKYSELLSKQQQSPFFLSFSSFQRKSIEDESLNRLGRDLGFWVMGSEGLQAVRAYRHLLKAVKKHIGGEDSKRHFTDFITQEFRKTYESSIVPQKINLARNYTYMLSSVHHHMDLLFSYNIAVDRSEEMTRTLKKSAASVGLQLPDVYRA